MSTPLQGDGCNAMLGKPNKGGAMGQQTNNKRRPGQAARTKADTTASIRVLLLEDEPTSSTLTALYLQTGPQPATVTTATTLKDGLAWAERERFDLAIVDLNLPDSS